MIRKKLFYDKHKIFDFCSSSSNLRRPAWITSLALFFQKQSSFRNYSVCLRKLKVMKKLLNFILAILGFAGCNTVGFGYDEYGTPYASFEVKGIVTDGQKPIKDVKVSLEIQPKHGVDYLPNEKTTDGQGQFDFTVSTNGSNEYIYTLVANDLNGKYENDTIIDTVRHSDYEGMDEWYKGLAVKTANFELKEKNDK